MRFEVLPDFIHEKESSVHWARPAAPHGRYLKQLALLDERGRVETLEDVVGMLRAVHYYCVDIPSGMALCIFEHQDALKKGVFPEALQRQLQRLYIRTADMRVAINPWERMTSSGGRSKLVHRSKWHHLRQRILDNPRLLPPAARIRDLRLHEEDQHLRYLQSTELFHLRGQSYLIATRNDEGLVASLLDDQDRIIESAGKVVTMTLTWTEAVRMYRKNLLVVQSTIG